MLMNKKEAVAYAQITLDYMLSLSYTGEMNIENFGIEMRQAFKLYNRNIVLPIVDAKLKSNKGTLHLKEGSEVNG